MKIEDLKVGNKIYDRWYPGWGVGTVTKILKTRVHIDFSIRGHEVYDESHLQYLETDVDDPRFFGE
jgi:transcription elongation factor GreA-like protein